MAEEARLNRRPESAEFARYQGRMLSPGHHPRARLNSPSPLLKVPFATISVLVILLTLFSLSMLWGGWSWSSWTYAFSFVLLIPLSIVEMKRKAVITGGAIILLFFMVLIDAGMPGYFGYSPSDYNWYDNIAHCLGGLVLTLFMWSFLWWTVSPTGPPQENGRRKFWTAIALMAVISFTFEFAELATDLMFGWANFHAGVDTVGDIIFDFAGIASAGVLISRHRLSPIKRPFWHEEPVSG